MDPAKFTKIREYKSDSFKENFIFADDGQNRFVVYKCPTKNMPIFARAVSLVKAVALTVFTGFVGLYFSRVRDYWSEVFEGRKITRKNEPILEAASSLFPTEEPSPSLIPSIGRVAIGSSATTYQGNSGIDCFKSLLSNKEGIALGVSHSTREPFAFLVKNMQALSEAGVKVIFLEQLTQDYQKELYEFMQSNEDEIVENSKLDKAVNYHDVKQLNNLTVNEGCDDQSRIRREKQSTSNLRALIKSAKKHKVNLSLTDNNAFKGLIRSDRLTAYNNNLNIAISNYKTIYGPSKYITFTGMAHAMDTLGVKGMNTQLNIPAVIIGKGKKEQVLQEPDLRFPIYYSKHFRYKPNYFIQEPTATS